MATDGIQGFMMETRNYGATAAFWKALGYEPQFETDHASGQWVHPKGGPYLFIREQHDSDLRTHPVVGVADAAAFAPSRPLDYAQPFTPQHWGVTEAIVLDPEGREVSLQAPLAGGH